MRPKKKPYSTMMIILGAALVCVAGYYFAGGMQQGITIFEWEENMKAVLEDPFAGYFNQYTWKTISILGLIYLWLVLMYITSRKNYLPGKEMGSAQYVDVKKVNKRLADLSKDPDDEKNIVVLKKRWKEGRRM